MRAAFLVIFAVILALLSTLQAQTGRRAVFISEGFESLAGWQPVSFRNIEEHSEYGIEQNGDESYLVAVSNSSASGIVLRKEFDVRDYPRARWRWKISGVYERGDATSKAGDDYPIRVYVIFHYDPEKASFTEKIKYGLAKTFYGEYPPLASLNYIWANRRHDRRVLTSPYTDRSKLIILQSGGEQAGEWVEEDVNMLADYQEAFGAEPPGRARIAVMNDADNTGESSVSRIDFIEVYREIPER